MKIAQAHGLFIHLPNFINISIPTIISNYYFNEWTKMPLVKMTCFHVCFRPTCVSSGSTLIATKLVSFVAIFNCTEHLIINLTFQVAANVFDRWIMLASIY